MDTITIKTKMGKQALSRIASKLISDKVGSSIQINIEDIALSHGEDGTIKFDLKVNGSADESIINRFT